LLHYDVMLAAVTSRLHCKLMHLRLTMKSCVSARKHCSSLRYA